MTYCRRAIAVVALALGALAISNEARAQGAGMYFSVYLDISWTGSMVHGYASTYDGSWGCSHSDYNTEAYLWGPTESGYGQSAGLSVGFDTAFNGDDGTWTLSATTSMNCNCYGYYQVDDSAQEPLQRIATSVSLVSGQWLDSPPNPYVWQRIYQVRDQFGDALSNIGPTEYFLTESFDPNPPNGNCHGGAIEPGSTFLNTAGQFQDQYGLDGGPDPCSSTSTQSYHIDGNEVYSVEVTWNHDSIGFQ